MFKIKALSSAVAAAALLLGVGAAQADTYTFSQPFDDGQPGLDGGTLSGVFTGGNEPFSFLSLSFNGVLGGVTHTNVAFTPISIQPGGTFVLGDTTFTNPGTGFTVNAGPSGPASYTLVWSAGTAAFSPYGFPGNLLAFAPSGAFAGIDAVANPSMQVTPIPEPSTYLLMALGLGAVCFLARRRAA